MEPTTSFFSQLTMMPSVSSAASNNALQNGNNQNISWNDLCESDAFRDTMSNAMFIEFRNLYLIRKNGYENLQKLATQALADLKNVHQQNQQQQQTQYANN